MEAVDGPTRLPSRSQPRTLRTSLTAGGLRLGGGDDEIRSFALWLFAALTLVLLTRRLPGEWKSVGWLVRIPLILLIGALWTGQATF